MTRSFDFVVVTVVTIISFVIHLMGVELFAPGSVLYGIATDGTQNMNGQEWADFAWQALAIWVPLISIGGIWAWGIVREYKRQVQTAVAPARGP